MDSVGLNKGLGWFSIALGLVEIAGGRRIADGIGARGQAGLVRGYGVREIATGVGMLARPASAAGPLARVGGDLLDLATIAPNALRRSNASRTGALFALGIVAGALLVDLYAARASMRDAGPRT